MGRTPAAGRPVTARLLAVCALLFGLFLMHGNPMAADGCHGAMATAMPMARPTPMAHPAPAAMAPDRAAATAARSDSASRVTPAGMDGTLCVSTPARQLVPLAVAGASALAIVAAHALTGRRFGVGAMWWRGPPGRGRSVLLRVCVART